MSELTMNIEARIKHMGANWDRGNVDAAGTVLRLYRARDRIYNNATGVLAQYQVSHAEFDALVSLRTFGPQLTPTNICQANMVSSGGMTKVLKHLEELGYITREQDSGDQRCKLAKLTAKGEGFTEEVLSTVLERHERMLAAALDKKERKELDRLLGKLACGEQG